MLLYFEKGPKFQNFAYFTNFYFSSNIDVFSFVERIVVRAFGSMSTDFLYLLRFPR
jgi:hypothetical protein